jgi:hypothetical protein
LIPTKKNKREMNFEPQAPAVSMTVHDAKSTAPPTLPPFFFSASASAVVTVVDDKHGRRRRRADEPDLRTGKRLKMCDVDNNEKLHALDYQRRRDELRHAWVPVYIVAQAPAGGTKTNEVVLFQIGVWGPMAERTPLFRHVFDLDSLRDMRVSESVVLLRAAMTELESLGVLVPKPSQPPADKTKLSFPVFGWYLDRLAEVAEAFWHRSTLHNNLVWRVGRTERR